MLCYRALLASLVACACLSLRAAAEEPIRATIGIVLDCSQSMAEAAFPAGADAIGSESDARFDAARELTRDLLRQLSASGNYQVGLWMYGHRLKWEGEGEPQLEENTEYLGLTDGFKVLSQLVPGDDVEAVYPLGRIDDSQLDLILARLDAARAFGESPLYLALNKAIDALAADDHAAPKGIIVVTSGLNKQWVARSRRSKDDVVRAVASQPHLGIHFVSLGAKPEEEAAAEMRELAEMTGGSVEYYKTDGLLGRIENTHSSARTVSTGPPVRNLTGRVIYYKKPVRKARVTLAGSGLPPVQTDTTGTFLFQGVMPGDYTIEVEGIAKNVIRKAQMEYSVPAPPREMAPITIELP